MNIPKISQKNTTFILKKLNNCNILKFIKNNCPTNPNIHVVINKK